MAALGNSNAAIDFLIRKSGDLADPVVVRIMFRHILPNLNRLIIVFATIGVCFSLLSRVALSFIGLGAQGTSPLTTSRHHITFRNCLS